MTAALCVVTYNPTVWYCVDHNTFSSGASKTAHWNRNRETVMPMTWSATGSDTATNSP